MPKHDLRQSKSFVLLLLIFLAFVLVMATIFLWDLAEPMPISADGATNSYEKDSALGSILDFGKL